MRFGTVFALVIAGGLIVPGITFSAPSTLSSNSHEERSASVTKNQSPETLLNQYLGADSTMVDLRQILYEFGQLNLKSTDQTTASMIVNELVSAAGGESDASRITAKAALRDLSYQAKPFILDMMKTASGNELFRLLNALSIVTEDDYWAFRSLGGQESPAFSALIRALADSDSNTVRKAARMLGELGTDAALAVPHLRLAREQFSNDKRVCFAIDEAIYLIDEE